MKGRFEAKKHAYRQTQDGVVISFVVHPSDITPELAAAPLGTIFAIDYSDDEQDTSGPVSSAPPAASPKASPPAEAPHQAPAKDRRQAGAASSQDKLVVRAVMLCKEPQFQDWMRRRAGAPPFTASQEREEYAASWLRIHCKVLSRSGLAIDNDARRRFETLELEYKQDHGLAAVDHSRRSA